MKNNKQKELKHRNLLVGLHQILVDFLEPKNYANKLIERLFKQHKIWGRKDRAFVSEAFYEIVRWKKLYEFYAQKPFTEENMYSYIVVYLLKNDFIFPTFEELEMVNFKNIKSQLKKTPTDKATIHSIPKWLAEKCEAEIPNWEQELRELNKPASVVLRTNTLKISKKELKNTLLNENVQAEEIEGYNDALELRLKQNVFITMAFKNGYFEMQDANSQKVAEVVDAKPGERVIDSCAGAGGKTLHLANFMDNKGQIIALDIFQWKLNELKKRAKRAGAHNIQTKLIEDSKTLKRLHNTADKVLIDAPCSGFGVLKRNPDTKWKFTETDLLEIQEKQKNILQEHSKLVKKDGFLIYVTCSILPTENEAQIEHFIQENKHFQIISQETLLPSKTGYDGFFICKMKRFL